MPREKLALEAVIGVVGVALVPFFGGGVTVPSSFEAEPSYKAAIFEAVGVLNGRRFRGGSLNGCKVRLFILLLPCFLSVAGSFGNAWRLSIVGFDCTLRPWSSLGGAPPPEVEVLFTLLLSAARLDFR